MNRCVLLLCAALLPTPAFAADLKALNQQLWQHMVVPSLQQFDQALQQALQAAEAQRCEDDALVRLYNSWEQAAPLLHVWPLDQHLSKLQRPSVRVMRRQQPGQKPADSAPLYLLALQRDSVCDWPDSHRTALQQARQTLHASVQNAEQMAAQWRDIDGSGRYFDQLDLTQALSKTLIDPLAPASQVHAVALHPDSALRAHMQRARLALSEAGEHSLYAQLAADSELAARSLQAWRQSDSLDTAPLYLNALQRAFGQLGLITRGFNSSDGD